MQHSELEQIVARFRRVESDLTGVMSLIGELAAEWVETRHEPAVEKLDGWRPRDEFIDYVMQEANIFPRTFDRIVVSARPVVVADHVALDPLSMSGNLRGQGRQVDIRFRITLHYDAGRLVKITGALSPGYDRDDVIAWLKAVEQEGGINPSRPVAERPAT